MGITRNTKEGKTHKNMDYKQIKVVPVHAMTEYIGSKGSIHS
jgi:hypothetical protein